MTTAIIAAAILRVTLNAAGHATLTDTAVRNYARIIEAESERHGIDALILVALIDVESNWRPRAENPDTGALGLMQIIASPEMLAGGFDQFIDQLKDPGVNVFLGARRLRHFIDLCHGNVWAGVDAFNGRGIKRKQLSPFALKVRATYETLTGVVVTASMMNGVNK